MLGVTGDEFGRCAFHPVIDSLAQLRYKSQFNVQLKGL